MEGLATWHLWVVVGLVLAVLEIKLSGFVTLWFALGAFAAALMAGLGLSLELQLAAFSALSLVLFVLSRTLFQRLLMRTASTHKQGAEAMLGSDALVTEPLPAAGFGTVRINGELWAARSLTGPVAEGAWVRIEQLDGLKLLVRPSDSFSPLSRKEPHT